MSYVVRRIDDDNFEGYHTVIYSEWETKAHALLEAEDVWNKANGSLSKGSGWVEVTDDITPNQIYYHKVFNKNKGSQINRIIDDTDWWNY